MAKKKACKMFDYMNKPMLHEFSENGILVHCW